MEARRYKQKSKYFSDKVIKTQYKIRRITAILCSATLIAASIPIVSMFGVGAQSAIYASTTDYLNLRSGAGTNYSIIKVIPKNTSVTVIDESKGNWLKVKLSDGTTGYCSSDYLDITTDAKTNAYLNMRKGPSTSYSIIKTISPNTKVDILRFSNASWVQIKLSDGTTGYVCTDYIDYITSNTTPNTVSKTTYAKTTTYLNMRTGAGTNYSIIKTLAPDIKVEILKNINSSWDQIKLSNGTTGYVCSDYLEYIKTNTTKNTLKLSESEIKIIKGTSKTITASASSGGTVKWSSSNTKVATISSSGVVKAVADGTATITAKDSKTNMTAICKVTVVSPEYKSITLSSTSQTIYTGKNFTLTAKTDPKGGKVYFKSSNTSVATVGENGVVKGLKAGNATITAYDATGVVKKTCSVTVKNKDSITISNSKVSVYEGLSVRISASASDSSMKLVWSSSNLNVASVNDGVISGLSSGTATITVSNEDGKIKCTCIVTVKPVSSSGVSVSRGSSSLTAGKTLYIKGYSSNSASWKSSDTSIATVSNGFIYAKKAGKVAISYESSNSNRAICVVTVYDAAPIKFAYSSPNSATLNSNVTLVAITDKTRTKVSFKINVNGKISNVEASSKVSDGNTYVWKANFKVTQAGQFDVTAYSYRNGAWKTCDDGKADIYVSSKTDRKTTSLDKLRASDEVIKFIGEKEGFVSKITYDTLANNIPTLGYGYVVWEGQTFYNNLTKNEGYALLVDAVNNDSYTSAVNKMLTDNNIYFNQQQFDSLVSFSYNLGTGWTGSSDLKGILCDSIGTSSTDTVLTGTVNSDNGLNLRSEPTTSSSVVDVILDGEKVTILSSKKYNNVWYKVKTVDGKTGYCSSTYLRVSTTGKVVRDLNFVNKNALIKEMLAYHHAGGNCYYGLLYRRADELEMFLYNDYVADGRDNKHNFPDPYCISFP